MKLIKIEYYRIWTWTYVLLVKLNFYLIIGEYFIGIVIVKYLVLNEIKDYENVKI